MYTDITPFNVTIVTINSTDNSTDYTFFVDSAEATYNLTEVIIFGTISSLLSFLTVMGNLMVMISFKIDKQLQTISNFFLFSLAVADFAIGLISMPLFTVSTLLGYWPLGPLICDTWLALDYLASNASVLNLLIISFDRYFSVMRPLTYRVSRTNRKAKKMIGIAWFISLLLWPPWIYSWPYIEGKRTVPDNQCYIQFIETNHYITFTSAVSDTFPQLPLSASNSPSRQSLKAVYARIAIASVFNLTAIAAFYAPVTVMCFLYWRIWQETEKRQKDLPNLQGGKKDSSRRSNSSVFVCSDEATNANSAAAAATTVIDMDERRRARSESSMAESDSIYMPPHRRKKHSIIEAQGWRGKLYGLRKWCVTWWYSGKDEVSDTEDDSPSEHVPGYITPLSIDTPLPSTVSRCTSLNVIRDPHTTRDTGWISANSPVRYTPRRGHYSHLENRQESIENVYTILITLPENTVHGHVQDVPSIIMIPDALEDHLSYNIEDSHEYNVETRSELNSNSVNYVHNTLDRRPSTMPDNRIPLNTRGIPKPARNLLTNINKNQGKKKKKPQEKKADRKAAKTLSAILLAFIITWTPYNILVLLKSLTSTSTKMPQELWDFFYYLCYINSTVNPMCYALTNATFRRTYWRIFRCKWKNRNRTGVNRGFYNT